VIEFAILDVGHGNAAVLSEANRAIVVDAGPGTGLLEYLTEQGIDTVEAVLISHADSDHLKGLVGLLGHDGIKIGCVYVNSDAEKESRQWKALVFDLDERARDGEIDFKVGLQEGMTFELSAGAFIEVLAPRAALAAIGPGGTDDAGVRIRTNTISAVARASLPSGATVLLAGDVDELGLAHLLKHTTKMTSDVLVFPHHGGKVDPTADADRNEAFAASLVSAVQPKAIVFSIGRHTHENPRPEIVRASLNAASDARVMCTQLSKNCAAAVDLPTFDHLVPVFAAGRHNARSCAGTVTVTENGIGPAVEEHVEFIRKHAPGALCQSG
jgi:beta-lactamase superfamily II metal-dependent hydrolase